MTIQGSRIENLHSREVDRQSPTGLIFILIFASTYCTLTFGRISKCNAHIGQCFGYIRGRRDPRVRKFSGPLRTPTWFDLVTKFGVVTHVAKGRVSSSQTTHPSGRGPSFPSVCDSDICAYGISSNQIVHGDEVRWQMELSKINLIWSCTMFLSHSTARFYFRKLAQHTIPQHMNSTRSAILLYNKRQKLKVYNDV